MPRNTHFNPRHEPFSTDSKLHLQPHETTGPLSFLNPTRARFRHALKKDQDRSPVDSTAPHLTFQWRSRDNRKGRHALVIPGSSSSSLRRTKQDVSPTQAVAGLPPPTNHPKQVLLGLKRMVTYYPYWDISYLVAALFLWGSVIWVLNAFFAWLPLVRPSSEFPREVEYGGGITAFIGATIFEVGSVLLMLEAVYENRAGCFGWAVHDAVEELEHHHGRKSYRQINGAPGKVIGEPEKACLQHHHANRDSLLARPEGPGPGPGPEQQQQRDSQRDWTWWPTLYELRTHYLHDTGFLACLSQLVGATIFWISGFTALPGVLPASTTSPGLLTGLFWTPQVVGGAGFIISGTLFMLETQSAWWRPAWGLLGWHIGFWNLVGGIGFTLCGALGYSSASAALYESALATFWGSWAFLIGSGLQLFESLDKFPVEVG